MLCEILSLDPIPTFLVPGVCEFVDAVTPQWQWLSMPHSVKACYQSPKTMQLHHFTSKARTRHDRHGKLATSSRNVARQLTEHSSKYNLLPYRQSADRRHHSTSTETAMLRVLWCADCFRCSTLLSLLGVSATFDCVDQSPFEASGKELQPARNRLVMAEFVPDQLDTGSLLQW